MSNQNMQDELEEQQEWVDAIDNNYYSDSLMPNLFILEKVAALSDLPQGDHYLETLSFIAGLMLELDGGLTGTNLSRTIKHDRLKIDIKFGKEYL